MAIPSFISSPDPSIYLSDNYVVLDFETTGEDYGTATNPDNGLVTTVFRYKGRETLLNVNEYKHAPLLEAIEQADFIVAHNAKFELGWLKRCGLDLTQALVFDTQIAEYVLLGNRAVGKLSLGVVAKKYGYGTKDPYIDILMKSGICPSDMPRSLLNHRCRKDVEQTENIFLKQRALLHEADQLKTLYTRCIFTPVLADIEFNGLHLDGERVVSTYSEYQRSLTECSNKLATLSGGINLRSTKQLADFLYSELGLSELTDKRGDPLRTPAGRPKTDSETITRLATSNKRQRDFISTYKEFNKLSSALSKNLEFFMGVVKEMGSTFLGQFNQTVTQTHRLSASGRRLQFDLFEKPKSVQFQNLPRAFKPMFSPRNPGWSVAEADGSQLEFRVAAHLGRDEVATQAIREGFDVHSFTAQVLTENKEPTKRQEAKAHTFKPLYGGNSGTKAQRAYYAAFRERYGGIASTQQEWIHSVLANKKLTIPSGLTFRWPDTRLDGNYITNTPSICNYPVQSYATADIIPIAVTKLWHEMKARELNSFLVNTVHDSAISELHPDEHEEFKDIAFDAFTNYVYYYLQEVYNDAFTVPLGAEIKIGGHWSEGEETSISVEPPLRS